MGVDLGNTRGKRNKIKAFNIYRKNAIFRQSFVKNFKEK